MKFLNPSLNNIRSPFSIKDIGTAVRRIYKAIKNADKILIFGDYDVTVTTSTRAPVPGALVCLRKDSDVYVYGYTNGSGSITLPVHPTSEGDIDLTVTGYNRIPHLGTMSASGSVAPAKPMDVTTQVSGSSDLLLTWSPVTQDVTGSPITIDHYNVYRNTISYFMVGGTTPIGQPTTNQLIDLGAVGNSLANYYYRVVAISTGGRSSAPSATAGEFDYDLQ